MNHKIINLCAGFICLSIVDIEHNNEPSGSMKVQEIFLLSECLSALKKDSVPCSKMVGFEVGSER
jgi:hypothetical protein